MASASTGVKSLWLSYLPSETDLKALYTEGKDNRHNLFEPEVPSETSGRASSVACLVYRDSLSKRSDLYKWKNVPTMEARFGGDKPFPPGTPFVEERSPGFGTAFLVGERLMLTAGHCVRGQDIVKIRVVFGFCMKDASHTAPINKTSVCKIKAVLKSSQSSKEGDWALVGLERHPVGLTPLKIDFTNVVHDVIPIYMLGHPSGLPLKYTQGGMVAEKEPQRESEFEAKIDAFAGNSGSPVFNALTHRVIGILVRGNLDFDKGSSSTSLHHASQLEIQKGGYEKCQRTTTLPDEVVALVDPGNDRKALIEECLKVQGLVQDKKQGEAVERLNALADKGVEVANCALSALMRDTAKAEKYKNLALQSGFFSAQRIGNVIESVTAVQPVVVVRAGDVEADDRSSAQVVGVASAQVQTGKVRATNRSNVQVVAGVSDGVAKDILTRQKTHSKDSSKKERAHHKKSGL
ncbi:MAG: trypsin-like serine peptidase [Thermodesulfobacteriota bacterium]